CCQTDHLSAPVCWPAVNADLHASAFTSPDLVTMNDQLVVHFLHVARVLGDLLGELLLLGGTDFARQRDHVTACIDVDLRAGNVLVGEQLRLHSGRGGGI